MGENFRDINPRKEIRNHRASTTEYKIWKRESQVQKIPWKTLTQQSKKMKNARSS